MRFTPQRYFYASGQRIEEAQAVHARSNDYVLAMYWSGVAVECMLRAYLLRVDPQFDCRHDIRELLLSSRLVLLDSNHLANRTHRKREAEQRSQTLKFHANTVYILWRNNLRYEDKATVANRLRGIALLARCRGDVLKVASGKLLQSARVIIERGKVLW